MDTVTERDLGVLGEAGERPRVIKAVRDHHHRVARLIAEGKRTSEVAAEVGLTVSRVSILKGDPEFARLVEGYRERLDEIRDEVFAHVYRKAELLRMNALDAMNERYENDPHAITDAESRAHLQITNEMLEEKVSRSVQLHGNLRDMSLAQLVHERRARADRLERADTASLSLSLPGEADGAGVDSLPQQTDAPAPTKQTDEQTTDKDE
jgi:hypothetical protein